MVTLLLAMLFSPTWSVTPQGIGPHTPLAGDVTSIMVEFSGPLRENNTYDGCHGRWLPVEVPVNVNQGGAQPSEQVPGQSQRTGADAGSAQEDSGEVEDSRGE